MLGSVLYARSQMGSIGYDPGQRFSSFLNWRSEVPLTATRVGRSACKHYLLHLSTTKLKGKKWAVTVVFGLLLPPQACGASGPSAGAASNPPVLRPEAHRVRLGHRLCPCQASVLLCAPRARVAALTRAPSCFPPDVCGPSLHRGTLSASSCPQGAALRPLQDHGSALHLAGCFAPAL